MEKIKILVTGCAGFIGSHLTLRLLKENFDVFGIDNLNNYYDVKLKNARLEKLLAYPQFKFEKNDITDRIKVNQYFSKKKFNVVIHLAAQVGVRHSFESPESYIDVNLLGFGNILEACRKQNIKNLFFASSSSVYGANTKLPFSEKDDVGHPISFYAATKRANELMALTYSSLHNVRCVCLRFFSVYGPWGRPDMALFKFTKSILENRSIDIYNNGQMYRDFTYIDDIVEGIVTLLFQSLSSNNFTSTYQIYNIGNGTPISLMTFINTLENVLGKKAIYRFLPLQPGDVVCTTADMELFEKVTQFKPKTSVENGISSFVNWYLNDYLQLLNTQDVDG